VTDEQPDTPEMDAVRRLLAEARHTEPVPDDVRTRLDGVLAELAAERSTPALEPQTARSEVDGPADLTARRRRRQVVQLLGAAAVIVLGGVGVAQLHHGTSEAGSPAGSATSEFGDTGNQAAPNRARAGKSAGESPRAQSLATPTGQVVVVRRGHLASAARRAQRRVFALRGLTETGKASNGLANGSPGPTRGPAHADSVHGAACVPTPHGAVVLPARFDGKPAALVYHRPRAGTQVVDLVLCGTAHPLRSVTVPAH
jgi:hypothetical protein